ncbi:MAG: amidohydrolase [Acidobacteria bacterium]|nr:MAG: amidohydrolase [Acidobacteriota bacterium]REK08826.1 MAG: amidohydrolase [Acidobacteriota bacterium]
MMFVVATTVSAQPEGGARLPVFDVHLHALAADAQGPPPLGMCTPVRLPTWDPQRPYAETFLSVFKEPACDDPIWSPMDDEELLRRTLDELEEHHVFGVLSADLERGRAWAEAAPGRFVRGLGFNLAAAPPPPDELRRLVEAGEVEVLSEVTNQYSGIAPDDPRMEPYWALAEELDLPVGIHVGTGPPGSPYLGSPGYRAAAHSALTMEPVLARHPKLRVYLMHAGYPLLEDLLALLYTHPQVHVGIGVIVYTQPREAFYRFLRGIVEAGFAKRVMFGSDQMVWPEVIGRSIRVIEEAPFLSAEQKRDILYGNAARFFRFDEEEIARHHGRGE